MKLIDKKLLDKISCQAEESLRLRMNYNFHETSDSPVQRLLNALEPGTELPIHRHTNTAETYIVLRGELKVLLYSNEKKLLNTILLNPEKGNFGINIPKDQWHTVEVLQKGTTIFEVKEGPYKPLDKEDIMQVD